MKDANELREMISTFQCEGDIHFAETMQYLENSADILVDTCKAELEKAKVQYNYYKNTLELLISFGEISDDFTVFKKINILLATKKGYFEEKIKDTTSSLPANYQAFSDFDFAIQYANVPISGLEKKHYDWLTYLKNILEQRGFFCCVRNGYNSISFAIVLRK